MEYLLKASAIIAIFFIAYKLVLQKETFFQSNRWFLLTGIFLAVSIPLIVIPIYIEYIPTTIENTLPLTTSEEMIITPEKTFLNFWQLLTIGYGIGVIFFLGKLCIELTSLQFLFKKHSCYKSESFYLIETNADISPFSFFNWIVFNPKKYSQEELNHILNHEKAHAKQMHSIDIILTQFACIILWFNPFIWLYKKEIQQNLEFIADKKAQDFSECEKSYQLVLLKSSVPQHKFLITNKFYNSQIKKRIVMLHKSKSNKLNAWKYGLILPALALFLMSFNTKKVLIEIENPIPTETNLTPFRVSTQLNNFYEAIEGVSSAKKAINNYNSISKHRVSVVSNNTITKVTPQKHNNKSLTKKEISITKITKNTSDFEFKNIKEKLKKEGLSVKFKGIKRNKSGEITSIKIDVSSKKSNTNYHVSSDEAIAPIKIIYNNETDNISIGNSHTRHRDNAFVFKSKDGKHKIHNSSSSNVYMFSNEEHDDDDVHEHEDDEHEHEHETKYIIKRNGKKGKVTKVKRSKNVHVISDDDDVIEIIMDEDGDENNVFKIIVDEDDDDHKIEKEKIIIKNNGKSIWVSNKDNHNDDVIILKNSKSNIFISDDGNKKPLYIINGKESTKDELEKLLPDAIESINVLKGKAAIKIYGDEGKDGVIEVTTKKKN